MEISTLISSFSHILNIKGKLSSNETTVVRSENPEEFNKQYCSIFLEHSYDPMHIGLNKKETIELVLAKRSDFTIPIRHIDWVILETKLDPFKPFDSEIPTLLLVKSEGIVFTVKDLNNILRLHVEFLGLKGNKLKKALESLSLQCRYADGHNVRVSAQPSLKKSMFELLSK